MVTSRFRFRAGDLAGLFGDQSQQGLGLIILLDPGDPGVFFLNLAEELDAQIAGIQDAAGRFQLLQQGKAFLVGWHAIQAEVDNGHMRAERAGGLPGLFHQDRPDAFRRHDRIAPFLQNTDHVLADPGLVVHHQDAHRLSRRFWVAHGCSFVFLSLGRTYDRDGEIKACSLPGFIPANLDVAAMQLEQVADDQETLAAPLRAGRRGLPEQKGIDPRCNAVPIIDDIHPDPADFAPALAAL